MDRRVFLVAAVLSATGAFAHAQSGSNANIVRWAAGTIAYRVASTGTVNGHENWRLTVHPDGSRTMAAQVAYTPRDVLRHAIHRIDAEWHPLESYVMSWIGGAWKGSALLTPAPTGLRVAASLPTGPKTQDAPAPPHVSIVPHLLAIDSWRARHVDRSITAPQPVSSYNFNAVGDGPDGLLGRVMDYRITYLGPERVTVPAGTFATEHYRIEDAVDLYLTGEDFLVVKFVYAAIDREHHLITFEQGPTP